MTPIKAAAEPSGEGLAQEIWKQKPDCGGLGKPWPFDGKTPKEVRTIKHDMPASLELCFLYADIVIKYFAALRLAAAPAGNDGATPEYVLSQLHAAIDDIDISAYNAAKYRIGLVIAALPQPREAEPGKPVSFMDAMNIVERGFDTWKDKPHNAKWYSRIDGTPIPNDIKVNIAEAICHSTLTASPSPIPEAPGREEIARLIRGALVENWKEDFGAKWDEDVLLTGCRRVGGGRGYHKPEEAAQNLALDAADAILRALKPQYGGNCEHGIAKVNCGICVPSKMFSKPQDGGGEA